MKYVGLDYGTTRVGVSVSNKEGTIAFPRETFANDSHLLENIVAFAQREGAETIIFGDTRTLSGEANDITERAEAFARTLAEALKRPLVFAREGWSSVEAARFDPEGEHDDAAAAAVILQRYLDMHPSRVE